MTFKITQSTIDSLPFDYAAEVRKFWQAKMDHRETLDPAPRATEIIENAITRVQYPIAEQKPDDFVIDYEVVDDVPVPTLSDRKTALVTQLRLAEIAAFADVISPARERLLLLDANAVYAKAKEQWSDADNALMAKLADIGSKKTAIQRHFANLEIEVEDLTEATIDAWSPAPFAPEGERVL